MKRAEWIAYLVVIGLLGVTAVALKFGVDVQLMDSPGIGLDLPRRAGDWIGKQIGHCHAEGCLWFGVIEDGTLPAACPECGEPLYPMARVEKEELPADTEFVRYRYRRSTGETLVAAIVLSGRERRSIHRPQRCLVAQGMQITRSHVVRVPLAGRGPLSVMVLDVLHPGPRRTAKVKSYHAYWFVGQGRETPYHLERMFWLAWDRLVHGVGHRWAYVIVQGEGGGNDAEFIGTLEDFIATWYPPLLRTTP